jgi:hypothetical protein
MADWVLYIDKDGIIHSRPRLKTDGSWKEDYQCSERLSYWRNPEETFVPYAVGSQFTESQHHIHGHLLACRKTCSVKILDDAVNLLETIILQPSRTKSRLTQDEEACTDSGNNDDDGKEETLRTKQRKDWKHNILIDVSF